MAEESPTPKQPLAEVFGFPVGNLGEDAQRHRRSRLCPFNNKVPNCTKDKANAPLGTCSIRYGDDIAITCPVRFREDWMIAEHAASFFFPPETTWTSLTEVKLKDANGTSAGNIDVVLVSYDNTGKVTDFGALEIQAVYISGNVRMPFEHYMEDSLSRANMDWTGPNFPRPDYLSSSRKRLAPQLIYKGGILKSWGKKSAVAIGSDFFATLPKLEEVAKEEAEVAWLVYDMDEAPDGQKIHLVQDKVVYTKFNSAMLTITTTTPGDVGDFVRVLQDKLDEKLEGNNPPDAPVLDQI